MRNLRLFISEGPEMAWLLFREQNQLSPHGESGPLCRFLPCQKHLVGFGMLLNSASAVPIRGPHDVQDALETPCPSAPGARGALPGGHRRAWQGAKPTQVHSAVLATALGHKYHTVRGLLI